MSEVEQTTAGERRERTRTIVERMLTERTEMLVLMCEVSGLQPFTQDKPVQPLLEDFCQILVDYIAAGHFGLYERINRGQERRKAVKELAQEIYPRIEQTTCTAVEFNEKYDSKFGDEHLKDLHDDLSRLAENLTSRIELEDRLIETMVGEALTASEVLPKDLH